MIDMGKRQKSTANLLIYVFVISGLFISLLGATLSYYLVMVSRNSVNATSAYIKLNYTNGKTISMNQVIPGNFREIDMAYRRDGDKQCLDMYDREVCTVYGFTIENIGDKANFVAYLRSTINEFSQLSYALYELDDNDNPTLIYPLNNENNILDSNKKDISLFGYDKDGKANTFTLSKEDGPKRYEVVLYINNLDKFQVEEMGKRYFGSVIIQLVNYNGNIVIENR